MRKFRKKFPKYKPGPTFAVSLACIAGRASLLLPVGDNFFWLGPIRDLLSYVVFSYVVFARFSVAVWNGAASTVEWRPRNTRLLRMRSKP